MKKKGMEHRDQHILEHKRLLVEDALRQLQPHSKQVFWNGVAIGFLAGILMTISVLIFIA